MSSDTKECPFCAETIQMNIIGDSSQVAYLPDQLPFETITLRPNERGMLKADFARCPVWTVREDGTLRQEWLLIRQDKQGS